MRGRIKTVASVKPAAPARILKLRLKLLCDSVVEMPQAEMKIAAKNGSAG